MRQTHFPNGGEQAVLDCPQETPSEAPTQARPLPDSDDPMKKARAWWRALSAPRRAGFSVGALTYFASYEYVHDFGVKHPLVATLGVAVMIISGGLGRE